LNQLLQLREFGVKQGWTVVAEYTDEVSAKNGHRTGFQRMWKDAAGVPSRVRRSSDQNKRTSKRLKDQGIAFKSYTEQYIDSLGAFSDAIIGILGAIAEQERIRISDRTKAGLARVGARGSGSVGLSQRIRAEQQCGVVQRVRPL
jgi:DNA invertase Pin-like site-specific DNA recombinase